MKVKIKSYHAIALWKWNLNPTDKQGYQGGGGDGDEAGDEEDDVCGICRVAFDGCCPECRVPGDDCPLSEFKFPPDLFFHFRLPAMTDWLARMLR